MLNATIHRKLQFIAAILLAFLVAAATVYPMRIYTEDHVYSSGLSVVSVSDEVTEEYDAGDYFIAQYDHLQTLEFYVNSVVSGTQATFQLFHYVDAWTMELVAQETVDLPEEVPGYAVVSVDADLEVGETYVYTVRGLDGSRFTVGFESLDDALDTGNAPLYTLGFYHDTTQEGLALQMRVTYRVELSKWPSLAMIGVFLLIAVLLIILVGKYYKKRPERNAEITVLQALQHVFTPVTLAAGALAFLAVWPMKLFDSRLLDILVYETGIVLAVLLILYALWHDRKGVPSTLSIHHLRRHFWHYGIIFCIALIMNYSAEYMNATSDLVHYASMNMIAALICVIIYFMGDTKANLSGAVFTAAFLAAIINIIYYCVNRLPKSDPDFEAGNRVLRTQGFAWFMAAIAVTATVMTLLQRRKKGIKPLTGVSKKLLIPVAVLAAMLVVFRNTRQWIVLLIAVWALFYVRYRYWNGRARLLQDLCEGIILDFLFKVGYSMLHRYYMAYRFSRFSMHFHTVTVTAYYLVIVSAAAFTLFAAKWIETSGIAFRERLAHIWKETFLVGLVGAYMMMSLTRSGIGVFAIMVVVTAIACGAALRRGTITSVPASVSAPVSAVPLDSAAAAGNGNGRKIEDTEAEDAETEDAETEASRQDAPANSVNPGKGGGLRAGLASFGAIVLAILLTFPMAFTGQRLISTVYAQPERFEDLETYDDWLVRNVSWNCTRFMNIEIFIRDFGDRVLGGEIGSNLYYGLGWNIPQGYRTSELEEIPLYEEKGMLASAEDEAAAGLLLSDSVDLSDYEDGSLETGDVSNGRIGLYLAYLQNLNFTGHDAMGVELSSGEIAMHAHNIVLQVAYDCGIPTAVVFLVVLLMLLWAAFGFAGRRKSLIEADEGGAPYRRGRYALMPFLLLGGFCVIGVVEWIFHFSNPFTIAVMFALAPLLFPEREETGTSCEAAGESSDTPEVSEASEEARRST